TRRSSDLLPKITIAPGATANVLGPGSFNASPAVLDKSGNNTNLITHPVTHYVPILTTPDGLTVLGNGAITGSYSRQGSQIFFTIELMIGRSTILGRGELRFSVPVQRASTSV